MFIFCRYDTDIVPTGLKRVETAFFYKHIVPTGLKTLPQRIYTLKLTLMGFASLYPTYSLFMTIVN